MEETKTGLISLQAESRAAVSNFMSQIETNNRERQKLEMVMRDMKSGVQELVKQRVDVQKFVDMLNRQCEVPAPAKEDFLRADLSKYSREQLILHIALLKSKISNEFTTRQQLESLVSNLQSAVTALARRVQQLEEKRAKK